MEPNPSQPVNLPQFIQPPFPPYYLHEGPIGAPPDANEHRTIPQFPIPVNGPVFHNNPIVIPSHVSSSYILVPHPIISPYPVFACYPDLKPKPDVMPRRRVIHMNLPCDDAGDNPTDEELLKARLALYTQHTLAAQDLLALTNELLANSDFTGEVSVPFPPNADLNCHLRAFRITQQFFQTHVDAATAALRTIEADVAHLEAHRVSLKPDGDSPPPDA
ncbi:hypothetical protein Hypma_016616 [Hypsizygus marmoreus]|uniref:Uncharacterized protein n=1 Tax=Hypsizygus marmoreus TaxID=39966 RepID=A0A369J051_HYPMA|nr:hypothetical protein Hypma_016616 [Hypsizygus marmoreus]